MERTPTYGELIKMGMSPEEARKFLAEQRKQSSVVRVPPLEAYVEGPPEVEVRPLKEEPLAILPAYELTPIIEGLREDTEKITQVRIDFDGQRAWVVPTPRYTLRFETPKWAEIGAFPIRDPEEVRRYHESLKWDHPDWEIERRYERGVNVFYGRPPERRHVRRSDPYLMALEVVKLKPKRLALQTVPRIIRPPKAIPVEALPWRFREVPEPRQVWY